HFGWAAFMAGGSMADIPKLFDPKFLEDASSMVPVSATNNAGEYRLANKEELIVYGKGTFKLDLSKSGSRLKASWIDPKNGKEIKSENIKGGRTIELKCPVDSEVVLWLHK